MNMLIILLCILIQVAHADSDIESPSSCLAKKITEYKKTHTTANSSEGRVRANPPGWAGGVKTAVDTLCYKAPPENYIEKAQVVKTSDNGRYHIGQIEYLDQDSDNHTTLVCVTFKAWSDSISFGAGGWLSIELKVDLVKNPPKEELTIFQNECNSKQ